MITRSVLQVTVGDVAAQAGVKPSDAEAALQALAADTQGTLEVQARSPALHDGLCSQLRCMRASHSLGSKCFARLLLERRHHAEPPPLRAAQVASTGDVVYALPQDFQATLRARSWWLRAQPVLAQVPSPPASTLLLLSHCHLITASVQIGDQSNQTS